MDTNKIVYLIFLMTIPVSIFAGGKDSLIVKGYYFERYNKNEIMAYYYQKKKSQEGKSHRLPIDFTTDKLFFPNQVGEDSKCVFPNSSFGAPADNDSLYIIPDINNIELLKRSGLTSKADLTTNCIITCAIDLSPYYIIANDDRFLYKCVYIEGYLEHTNIHSIPVKWQNYILDMFSSSSKVRNQELYVLYIIKNYNPYIDDKRFQVWLPY